MIYNVHQCNANLPPCRSTGWEVLLLNHFKRIFFYFQKACIQLCSCYALVSELTKRTDCYNLWKIHCGNVKKECIQLCYCYALLSKHNLELRKESTVTIYGKYSMQVIRTLQKPPKLAFASLYCHHSNIIKDMNICLP